VQDAEDVMDAFTREFLPLASTYLPFTSTSVASTTIRASGAPASSSSPSSFKARSVPGTLVSNVFVCKLPAESDVAHVFRLVVENLKRSPVELSQRLGIHLDFSVLPPSTDAHQVLPLSLATWREACVLFCVAVAPSSPTHALVLAVPVPCRCWTC